MAWSTLSGLIARRIGRREATPTGAAPDSWQESLRLFFAQRAGSIAGVPGLEDLCFISGRDPRLWMEPGMVEDLARSIVEQGGLDAASSVLEVGCASGFLARAIAPHVARYTGVDLAEDALRVARRLALANARFVPTDGGRLPFDDDSFDGSVCYDVFTNFPRFRDGEHVVAEMLRVTRPARRALVGSIPNAARKAAYEARSAEVARALDAKWGPVRERPETATRADGGVTPGIVCYYFSPEDFVALGDKLGARTEILDIHPLNPYVGYRFNAVYHKPAA